MYWIKTTTTAFVNWIQTWEQLKKRNDYLNVYLYVPLPSQTLLEIDFANQIVNCAPSQTLLESKDVKVIWLMMRTLLIKHESKRYYSLVLVHFMGTTFM